MTETSQNETYQYDPSGLRVARHYYYNGTAPDEVEIFTYDVASRRILTSTCMVLNAGSNTCTLGKNYQRQTNQQEIYFAGRLVGSGGGAAFRDRLGSVRASGNLGWPVNYLPYGEERNSPPTADGQMKFATYYRDSTIDSQDYANQRYYSPGVGRFNSADPGKGSNGADPLSWNKYAYTGGDPINRTDVWGTSWEDCGDGWVSDASLSGPCSTGGYQIDSYFTNGIASAFQYWAGIANCTNPTDVETLLETDCADLLAPILVAAAAVAANSTTQEPCDFNILTAYGLDYSQLLYKKGTQSTKDHIIERHMYGTASGTSQYSFASYFWQVQNFNALTALTGQQRVEGSTVVIEATLGG